MNRKQEDCGATQNSTLKNSELPKEAAGQHIVMAFDDLYLVVSSVLHAY